MTELVSFWWQHVQQQARAHGQKTLRELLEEKRITLPQHALHLRWYVGPSALIKCHHRSFVIMDEGDKGLGLFCTEALHFGDFLGYYQGEQWHLHNNR